MTELEAPHPDRSRSAAIVRLHRFMPVVAAVPAAIGGMAASRILYEALFPALWLGNPLVIGVFALIAAVAGALWWRRRHAGGAGILGATLPLLPLLLNLATLFDPVVDLVGSRFFFLTGLWLMGYIGWVRPLPRRGAHLAWLWLGLGIIYLETMAQTVGRADTFEFQVVAPQLGIAHPTGYPLYLLLGKLFTLYPFESVAWRLNLATMIYGLGALAALFLILETLAGRRTPALIGAIAFGLTPTFWSQTIEAEVYTLHLLLTGGALALMARWLVFPERLQTEERWLPALPLLIGLGLTNHLTTVLVLPAAALFVWFSRSRLPRRPRFWLMMVAAFLAPLMLYAYLPLRWAAVNGEPMGLARFVDWVVGGRFRGALQLDAWLRDPTRTRVVGRLFLAEWGWFGLAWSTVGWLALARRQPRVLLLLLITWAGFTFYALNYLVPDLAVFLLPAQLIVAIGWGAVPAWFMKTRGQRPDLPLLVALAALCLPLLGAPAGWVALDRSRDDGLTTWGEAVLALPLEEGAAILADSEKIAPLYYLQKAEGVRPDLDILVLPDEATYRAELDQRLAAGQAVYLARYLPGLESAYHLSSMGPLLQVRREAAGSVPEGIEPANLPIEGLRLLGYALEPVSPYDATLLAVTLVWQANAKPEVNYYVYLRYVWENLYETVATDPVPASGAHPAGDFYPTVAWRPGEVVTDFHQLPRPVTSATDRTAMLQVALAPRYTPEDSLAWHDVAEFAVPAFDPALLDTVPARFVKGDMAVRETSFPGQARLGATLPVTLVAEDSRVFAPLAYELVSAEAAPRQPSSLGYDLWWPWFGWMTGQFGYRETLLVDYFEVDQPSGDYWLRVGGSAGYLCGWGQPKRAGCTLGRVTVSGAEVPPGATNFADRFALANIDLSTRALTPGGTLDVTLSWLALSPVAENYTVFIQVLDEADRIVGQVDSWPLQGTFPTSQWEPGEKIVDPHRVQLEAELPAGEYRLIAGWYLLATGERLLVLDDAGNPVADRFTVTGLAVSP